MYRIAVHRLSRAPHFPVPIRVCIAMQQTAVAVEHTAQHSSNLEIPAADNQEKKYSRKIQDLVDQISKLTLQEASSLNELLKKTLKLPDVTMAHAAMMAPSSAAAKPAQQEEEAPAVVAKKTSFALKLTGFDPDQTKKVALIKEIKNVKGAAINLVAAKKFVEATKEAPQIIKEDMSLPDAEKLKETLTAIGAVCVIE